MGVHKTQEKERETVSQYKERIILERLKEDLEEYEALLRKITVAKAKVEYVIQILEERRNGK